MAQKNDPSSFSLTGRLLLAMPGMGDPRFQKAVIYVCAHDANGAMGLVINQTMPDLDFSMLLDQLDIEAGHERVKALKVMRGGPVETARGFLLHSSEFIRKDTVKIDPSFSITGTIDALKSIAAGDAPAKMLFILGYAGWGARQLDHEIQDNAWLVGDADPVLVFDTRPEDKWDRAAQKIGVNAAALSGTAGRA